MSRYKNLEVQQIAARRLVAVGAFKSEENALKAVQQLCQLADACEYAEDETEIRERYMEKEVMLLKDIEAECADEPGFLRAFKRGQRFFVFGARGPNAVVYEDKGGHTGGKPYVLIDAGDLDLVSGYSADELEAMSNGEGGPARDPDAPPTTPPVRGCWPPTVNRAPLPVNYRPTGHE